MNKKVMVVDTTGRGHAICDWILRSDTDCVVYYAPGCSALKDERIISVPQVSVKEPESALAFLRSCPVDLVFVSHIDAISSGFVDVLRQNHQRVIGPTRRASRLESSKSVGKQFCEKWGLPTARSASFSSPSAAKHYVASLPYACVVKHDGLCADGDGAIVCAYADEAYEAIDGFAKAMGADFQVVVEERLYGEEISCFAFVDVGGYLLFPCAQDYKRSDDGNTGKNCDGMGSFAPHPLVNTKFLARVREQFFDRLWKGLAAENLGYEGFVFLGLMSTPDGLRLLEINTRFGDSEAEVVLPGIQTNFWQIVEAAQRGEVASVDLLTDGLYRCSIAHTQGALAGDSRPGWPMGEFCRGQLIEGIGDVDPLRAKVFLANMSADEMGRPRTSGGRVLHVVGHGNSRQAARLAAYTESAKIRFLGQKVRTDIGHEIPNKLWLAYSGNGHGLDASRLIARSEERLPSD